MDGYPDDMTCQNSECGHMASAHADLADAPNSGSCQMENCACPKMMPLADAEPDSDEDAAARSVGLSIDALAGLVPGLADGLVEEFAADLAAAVARSGGDLTAVNIAALQKLPTGGCYRTGCAHLSSKHLDLAEDMGIGKCMADGCMCQAFQPKGSPGEPALPEPPVVASGTTEVFKAIAVHHTDTSDGSWDGPANEARLPSGDAGDGDTLKEAYAWRDPDADPDTKAAYKFIHHEVSADGTVGAANETACSTGIAVLNGGRGGTTIPDADRQGVYNHLKAHLVDAGRDPDSIAPLQGAALDGAKTFAVEDGEPGEPGGEPATETTEPPDMDGYAFRALLMQEGVETSDGRFIEPNATTWRTLPLSLAYQDKTEHGGMADTAAVNIGRIDSIERLPGAAPGSFDIVATGVIDDDDPIAVMAAHKIAGKFLRGVSVDLAVHSADIEVTAVDDDGWPIGERLIVTSAEIGMATVTSFPAFSDCQIEMIDYPSEAESDIGFELPEVGDRIPVLAAGSDRPSFTWHLAEPEHVEERAMISLTASGGPMAPPRDWFDAPEFSDDDLVPIDPRFCGGRRGVLACPLTVTDQGRVFGHLASWHVEHTASMNGRKMRAPRNAGYDLFNNRGVVRCADGADVPVGVITLDGGHANLRLDAYAAMRHYDDTRSAVIDCRVGTDEYGVWVAGALRPDVDELTLRRLRAASISGDWRPFGARHELVAACSVNTPGFPTMRQAIAASAFQDEDGPLVALVAAGALPSREEPTAEALLLRATNELAAARREREADRLARIIG